MDNHITFVVFTYNESRRIEYIMRCFRPYGKILVMDNHSTDNTAEICRQYGADVQLHEHTGGFAEHEVTARNVLSKVKTDWVYWGYADEILPHLLLRTLQEIAKEDRFKAVLVPRKNLFYGIRTLNLATGWSQRFFKKGFVDFTGNVIHRMGTFTGRPEELLKLPKKDGLSMHHCGSYDLRKFELAHSGYSDVEARLSGRFSPLKMIFYPIYFLLRYYLLRGEWRNGWAAFIMTMQYCFFFFNVEAKRWEIEHGVTLDSIEKNYDAIKEDILTRQ